MRYLLDTNILVFLMLNQEELSPRVRAIVKDYSNLLYTSSICIVELLHLYHIGKVRRKYKTASSLLKAVFEEYNVEILPFGDRQIKTLTELCVAPGHNDPFDHAVISHAIADRLTLISSDRKFEQYQSQRLSFVFNKR